MISFCCPSSVLADHSLADAMKEDPLIKNAVLRIKHKYDVICDLENSNQVEISSGEDARSAWKQIALCFKDKLAMDSARRAFVHGDQLGFYGIRGIEGVMIASYDIDKNFKFHIRDVIYR